MFKLTSQFAGLLKLCYEQMFLEIVLFLLHKKLRRIFNVSTYSASPAFNTKESV